MASKFLDFDGVKYLWDKIKIRDEATLAAATKYVDDMISTLDTDEVVNTLKDVLDVFKEYPEELKLKEYIDTKLPKTGGVIDGNLEINGTLGAGETTVVDLYADNLFSGYIGYSETMRVTVPRKNGTMALLDDLSTYLPLAGGAVTGKLSIGKSYINDDNEDAYFYNNVEINGELTTKGETWINNGLNVQEYLNIYKNANGVYVNKIDDTGFTTTGNVTGVTGYFEDVDTTSLVASDQAQAADVFANDNLKVGKKSDGTYALTIDSSGAISTTADCSFSFIEIDTMNLADGKMDTYGSYSATFPEKSGTVAFTSDLAVALTTAEIDQAIGLTTA